MKKIFWGILVIILQFWDFLLGTILGPLVCLMGALKPLKLFWDKWRPKWPRPGAGTDSNLPT